VPAPRGLKSDEVAGAVIAVIAAGEAARAAAGAAVVAGVGTGLGGAACIPKAGRISSGSWQGAENNEAV
jgi:hypothetical protein